MGATGLTNGPDPPLCISFELVIPAEAEIHGTSSAGGGRRRLDTGLRPPAAEDGLILPYPVVGN